MTDTASEDDLGTVLRDAAGPVALVIAEDGAALAETVSHHLDRGFETVLVALPGGLDLGSADPRVTAFHARTRDPGAAQRLVNGILDALPGGTWLYWGFNAEFLFHPHAETRQVSELLAFHESERRGAMPAMIVDLYPRDLSDHPDGVDLDLPAFDGLGYYAEPRQSADGTQLERQVTIAGGLRWRLEALVPEDQRRLDRVPLVRATEDLRLLDDMTWSIPEANTLSCPWHRNVTAAVVSFRAAKALATNPGPRAHLRGFEWSGSVTFDWSSRQLLDQGMMEVGQWF